MKRNAEIEELVRSAYADGAVPSPVVEEEVLAGLPEERARPRRRPPLALLAAAAVLLLGFALALALGDDEAPEGGQPADSVAGLKLELPVVPRPKSGVLPATEADRVWIARGGRVLIFTEKFNTCVQVSLDGLGKFLALRSSEHGKYAEVRPGVRASLLPVVLHVHRETPWQNVQWLMTVCAEQKIPDLSFAVLPPGSERFYRLDARLPTDKGLEPDRKPHIKVQVHLVSKTERNVKWGRLTVQMPERMKFRWLDREAEDLASVARWIIEAKKAAEPTGREVRGEIRAGAKVQFHWIATVLAEFRRAGYEKVDFYGTALPHEKLRQALDLPYPKHNYPPGIR